MITATFPDGTNWVILDPSIIDKLKEGSNVPIQVPELKLCIGYTPDAEFLKREMEKAKGTFTWREWGELLDAANKRPEVHVSTEGHTEVN